jgi:ubiquitin C-terminal hydrolase
MGIGHYKALINVAMGDRWWLFNDSQVTRASPDDIVNMMKRAYLAFYVRIDMIRQLFE